MRLHSRRWLRRQKPQDKKAGIAPGRDAGRNFSLWVKMMPEVITSRKNEWVRHAAKLASSAEFRRSEGLFIIEGAVCVRTLRTAASRSGRCSIPNRRRSGMPRIWSGWSPGPRVRICWRRMWRNCWRRPRRRRGFSVSVKSALGRWGWRDFPPKDTSWRSKICRTPAIWGRSCARRRHWGFPRAAGGKLLRCV